MAVGGWVFTWRSVRPGADGGFEGIGWPTVGWSSGGVSNAARLARAQRRTAMASISTAMSSGRRAAWTVVRAGYGSGKKRGVDLVEGPEVVHVAQEARRLDDVAEAAGRRPRGAHRGCAVCGPSARRCRPRRAGRWPGRGGPVPSRRAVRPPRWPGCTGPRGRGAPDGWMACFMVSLLAALVELAMMRAPRATGRPAASEPGRGARGVLRRRIEGQERRPRARQQEGPAERSLEPVAQRAEAGQQRAARPATGRWRRAGRRRDATRAAPSRRRERAGQGLSGGLRDRGARTAPGADAARPAAARRSSSAKTAAVERRAGGVTSRTPTGGVGAGQGVDDAPRCRSTRAAWRAREAEGHVRAEPGSHGHAHAGRRPLRPQAAAASSSAAAASALPPPRPAATGMSFSRRKRSAGRAAPAASRRPAAARSTRSSAPPARPCPRPPRARRPRPGPRAGRTSRWSWSADAQEDRVERVEAVGRRPVTARPRLTLARASAQSAGDGHGPRRAHARRQRRERRAQGQPLLHARASGGDAPGRCRRLARAASMRSRGNASAAGARARCGASCAARGSRPGRAARARPRRPRRGGAGWVRPTSTAEATFGRRLEGGRPGPRRPPRRVAWYCTKTER